MSYDKKYYESHREQFLAAQKKYLAKKRKDEEWLEKQNQYMKEYYAKNPKKRAAKREYDRIYYQTHKEYFRKKSEEYREEKKKCEK